MKTFQIDHNNDTISVDQIDKTHFVVHQTGGDLTLILKQDNEGANHWFKEGTDNETEETSSIGVAIDSWLTKRQ